MTWPDYLAELLWACGSRMVSGSRGSPGARVERWVMGRVGVGRRAVQYASVGTVVVSGGAE